MLKSISCEKLIKTPLTFKDGLNSVVGADDAHNSIGKSSTLMLIDFAFGGSDFPIKCDDVIRNVGNFKVSITFKFEKFYSFIRDTEKPGEVYRVDHQDTISIDEFNEFLKQKYIPENPDLSFRECVSGFFRIYQKYNYNDKRPLDIVAKEKWIAIRKRLLKIFDRYNSISALEKDKAEETKKLQDIIGTFNSGAVKKITQTQLKKNVSNLQDIHSEMDGIKNALKNNVTDIQSIINDRNLELKKEKDVLVSRKMDLEVSLSRIDYSLSSSSIRNSKSFETVVSFFPEINQEKLESIETFHQGISKILKDKLKEEKIIILENIAQAESDIAMIDITLQELVGAKDGSLVLLERLMELDRESRDINQQNDFLNKRVVTKESVVKIREFIEDTLTKSMTEIEEILNFGMKSYIEKIYADSPISPTITLGKGDYKFDHGDDRGTGKGYADMIALDLTFLDETCLPCLMHDSLLFKNMDVPAIEHLLAIYCSFKKQIFISIDEQSKYSNEAQAMIENSVFLKLEKGRVAFIKIWNKTSEQK